MKRKRHTRSTISRSFALLVSIAAVLAWTPRAGATTAAASRWTVAADSVATPPEPAPADTVMAPPPVAPAVAPVSAPAPPAAPALTKKQQRAQAERARAEDKKKRRADRRAARAVKQAKQEKKADIDSLAAWNTGKSWIMVRGGYAKSGETNAGGGAVGAALGYQQFLNARWAVGVIAQGDLLGKFGGAAEIEYPFTLELTRHYRWKTAVRPYLGVGGGAYYHKYFRSGNDVVKLHSGAYLVGGFNTPIGKRSILGIDGRMQYVSGDPLVTNPVFGNEDVQLMHYSLKLGWSVAY